MATIHIKQTTTSTPEQFVAGLTDFGPGRQKLFGNSTDEYLKVHDQGPGEADVTEGSSGVWERLHYDWSDPTHVQMTTTDSNLWGGHSGHTYTLTRKPDGTTDIGYVVVREGNDLKGRFLEGVFRTSARASWRRRSRTASRPSRPAATRRGPPTHVLLPPRSWRSRTGCHASGDPVRGRGPPSA